jgi:hypothetical protein
MTIPYQIHQKLRQRQREQQQQQSDKSLSRSSLRILEGKPFWIWDKEEHLRLATETNEQCCFNHIVGLPLKDYDGIKKEHPLYDYEKLLYDSLLNVDGSFKDKHLWVKKATGLGVTEFMLRITAWLCTKDDHFVNAQICIVTGPNIDIAIKLIKRLKGIFERRLGLVFQNKETVLELNGCTIEAFPSNHLDAYRALDNPKFIFLDEADMFRKSEQEDVRHVSERYIAKSDPYIVMVSTPDRPGGLFYNIENETEDACLYKRLKMDYRYGLGKIYTQQEIDKAKLSPGFGREYELQYLGKIGNVFSPLQIDRVVQLGEQFSLEALPVNQFTMHGCGIDPGFGSSKTAIVLTEHLKEEGKIRVLFAEEYDHPNPEDIANICFDIHRKYQNTFFFVDGANRGFITQLKVNFGESLRWEKAEDVSPHSNRVLPVNFATEHKQMLSNLHLFANKEYLCIPKQHDKLIISLRTAIANEYTLDKEETSYDDLLDALRLSLKAYKMK